MMKDKVKELGQITDDIISSWQKKFEVRETGHRGRETGYFCKECGRKILQTTCFVSIHAIEFEPAHAGSGKVVQINYPYCPKCDGHIDYATACYHVSILKEATLEVSGVVLLLNPGRTSDEKNH